MPRTQVFEIELEVPDDAPEFETRIGERVAKKGDWVLAELEERLSVFQGKGMVGRDCFVLTPKKAWRPATREDVAAQILGTKDFQWRFTDDRETWSDGLIVGYNNDDRDFPFHSAKGFAWKNAEVLA
jgi:hypothetical protein